MLHSATADPFKLALYKLMGKLEPSRRSVPHVTTTTEDWLWFQLAMVIIRYSVFELRIRTDIIILRLTRMKMVVYGLLLKYFWVTGNATLTVCPSIKGPEEVFGLVCSSCVVSSSGCVGQAFLLLSLVLTAFIGRSSAVGASGYRSGSRTSCSRSRVSRLTPCSISRRDLRYDTLYESYLSFLFTPN